MRYSNLQHRLIIIKDRKNISLFNPKTRKFEKEMQNRVVSEITGLRLFGKNEDRLISLTRNGDLSLFSLASSHGIGEVSYYRIELNHREKAVSISVCNRNEYLLVEVEGRNFQPAYGSMHLGCSIMVVFKVAGNTLVKTACIDRLSQGIGSKYALACCGYAGSHILWVGLTRDVDGDAQLYEYDTERGKLVD